MSFWRLKQRVHGMYLSLRFIWRTHYTTATMSLIWRNTLTALLAHVGIQSSSE